MLWIRTTCFPYAVTRICSPCAPVTMTACLDADVSSTRAPARAADAANNNSPAAHASWRAREAQRRRRKALISTFVMLS
jgi:hypothetical protein